MVHEPHAQADGTRIVSGADLTMAADMLTGDGSPPVEDTFRGEVRAEAHLDATGALLSRRWALQVEPTAGSAIADGTPGLPYVHTGSLRRLRADEAASIGQTGAIAPKHTQPSALQSGHFLGVPPRAVTSPALPGGSAPEHTAVGSGEAGGGAGG